MAQGDMQGGPEMKWRYKWRYKPLLDFSSCSVVFENHWGCSLENIKLDTKITVKRTYPHCLVFWEGRQGIVLVVLSCSQGRVDISGLRN
jgi:hypothetical protein